MDSETCLATFAANRRAVARFTTNESNPSCIKSGCRRFKQLQKVVNGSSFCKKSVHVARFAWAYDKLVLQQVTL